MSKVKYIQTTVGTTVNGHKFKAVIECTKAEAEKLPKCFVPLAVYEKEQARLQAHREKRAKSESDRRQSGK